MVEWSQKSTVRVVTSKATMSTPEPTTTSSETSEESLQDENVLKRVGSLPLVTSICDLVSANYTSIKRKNSCLQSVCNGAEKGVKSLTGVAVVSDTKELVNSTVTDVKNTVIGRLSGMVYRTKDAVHGSVKTTTSLVTSSMSMVMGTKMGQMAMNGVDAMLEKSHAFVDHYLLVTDDVMGELQACCDDGETAPLQQEQTQLVAHEGYLACLISLLKKLHCYVSQQSQRHTRHASQSLQRVLESQYLEWKAWLVALYYTITLPLRTVYLIVLFTIEELSSKIQESVSQTPYVFEDLRLALTTLECLHDLCRRILARVWRKMLEEENLNALVGYIRNILPFCFLASHCKCRT
ncbi:PREDICTED: perilipin-3-like [Gekko japonicus]|uniref:Perilipin n=1 Tax=Gekko japonicus TaxID=146911 RepID=A0ABM1KX63_GEKJA|nr:PREDICTED: perilipin-3-like [Gekko japonicus]